MGCFSDHTLSKNLYWLLNNDRVPNFYLIHFAFLPAEIFTFDLSASPLSQSAFLFIPSHFCMLRGSYIYLFSFKEVKVSLSSPASSFLY